MGIYTGLSEEALVAKIAELNGKLEELEIGDKSVVRVAGEGRMLEFAKNNGGGLRRLINSAEYELAKLRGDDLGQAIGVQF